MCRDCLKEVSPDRGNVCLEKGSYILNYSGCTKCNKLGLTDEKDRVEEESDDGEETVIYTHTCKECGHVIAEHSYSFSVDEEYQEYMMTCDLCGIGEATVKILP